MDERTAQYLASLRKTRSKNTVASYSSAAQRFERFLTEKGWFLGTFPRSVLSDWLAEQGVLSPASVRVRWSAIKKYLSWLSTHGYAVAPYDAPTMPRSHREIPGVLSWEQLDQFDALCRRSLTEPVRSAMRLLGKCSLRVSELCSLRMDDVRVVEGGVMLRVRPEASKGDAREVPTPREFERALSEYVHHWRKGRVSLWLFPSGRKHLSASTLQKQFRRLRRQMGVAYLTPHTMRRTWITLMHQSGVDVITLQRVAGHRSLGTTSLYTVPSTQDLLKAANQPLRR